ncbi:serine/threonine-protein phosphatase [Opitutaceae bacterium TAV4]|uniref:PP2C family protein-serine/threonine phosphatase n=1 Tax=Geminisphaera colitermitum TaxID=1148786 RepID=UPI000308D267|nr:PP2C family serine/threonine-protein phosphatase [Geminisphaera colitermitum]RRJ97931.1 serine/threonine-protein phosphatase [Opitutaceae bacterium TAV4]RRK02482.1 serine/threonine-protein phosphatase [Opitutaceae bacterium TAV3]
MTLESASITETGYQRPTNEDRFIDEAGLALFGVADGIGGLPFGAQAAECAAHAMREAVGRNPTSDDIAQITACAHQAVWNLARQLSPDTGIGTTLTAGLIRKDRLSLTHVGDSRCYRLRNDLLECLTEDDTVEIESRRRRARGEHVAIHESDRHTLTRCIGQPGAISPLLRVIQVRPGDLYLFTTDGITRLISDPELETMMQIAGGSLQRMLHHLVHEVLERGAPDNATAVLVRIKTV